MTEREVVITTEIGYEGLFSVTDLLKLAKDWAVRKGYKISESEHYESVLPEGKKIDIEVELSKKLSDYAQSVISITYELEEVTERVVERAGKKQSLNQGKVAVYFEGLLKTDWEKRWEVKPTFYLIRKIFEQYVYSSAVGDFKKEVEEDVKYLKQNMSAFLNLYKV